MVPNVEYLIIKRGGGGHFKLFYIFLFSFLCLKTLFADMLKELFMAKKRLRNHGIKLTSVCFCLCTGNESIFSYFFSEVTHTKP